MQRKQEYDEICELISSGAKMLVARDAAGRHRIKFRTGPFGILTKRYSVSSDTIERLRREYAVERFE